MDVTAWLLRHTAPRPFLVAAPGGTAARVAAQRYVREHGWRQAHSPAEANVLVVAGQVSAELRPYVEAVWRLLPAPKARAEAGSAAAVPGVLGAAGRALRDASGQRALARVDAPEPPEPPMADRGPDRDGLTLDRLHVPLGPLLPDWPAGLVVHTTLQGDIVQEATVHPPGAASWVAPPRAARLDACATMLAVAGWADAATAARRLRDDVLAGAPAAGLDRWARRVCRSRTLRWSLRGVGTTPERPDTPPGLRGDALTRLYRWADAARHGQAPATQPGWALQALPGLLGGTELATARLVVASLDLEAPATAEAADG